jgi:Transcriptional regulator containing an amidase domain and an AraC-type DNA-binding HTH domain
MTTPVHIALLALPESTASTLYGMYDLFKSAGRDWNFLTEGQPGPELIKVTITSAIDKPFSAANGITIHPQHHINEIKNPDVICVPDIFVMPGESLENRFEAEKDFLRSAYANGTTIATACSAALLLAEAGLLDGWQATTHWGYCDVMRKNYPSVKVLGQRSLVVSGEGQRLIMAGGGTTWLDLTLLLIARFCGVEHAMGVARVNLIDWHGIGQQPFAHLAPPPKSEDAVIAACQIWIANHYQIASPVAQMVERSGLPERSFKRRFQAATGMSPLEYVHTLRLEEAKQMLEREQCSIETIANEVGYEDAGFFSRLFRRHVGLTPAAYRKRFGTMRKELSDSTTTA